MKWGFPTTPQLIFFYQLLLVSWFIYLCKKFSVYFKLCPSYLSNLSSSNQEVFLLSLIIIQNQEGGLRWRHRKKCFISSHNQKKNNNQFKTKEQPELLEKTFLWKSNNQEVKETFNQSGGGAEMGSWAERMGQGSGWRTA